jgi:hypothetical protein
MKKEIERVKGRTDSQATLWAIDFIVKDWQSWINSKIIYALTTDNIFLEIYNTIYWKLFEWIKLF